MRPRRLRDAARLWASLADARGTEGRDALWAHPDMLPTAEDLDDPDGFVHREQLDFSELDKMLGDAAAGKDTDGPNLTKGDDTSADTDSGQQGGDPSGGGEPRADGEDGEPGTGGGQSR